MSKYNISDDIEYVMISSEEIDSLVKKIADQIDTDYPDPDSKLLLLCILKGSICFTGDLMKVIKRPVEVDFMKVLIDADACPVVDIAVKLCKQLVHDSNDHDGQDNISCVLVKILPAQKLSFMQRMKKIFR